jgi:hypothetical protein
MNTLLLIIQAIGCLASGMGFGMLIRDHQNRILYKQYEHKVVYTIDLNLIKEDEAIDDFINRAHAEKLGTYIIK